MSLFISDKVKDRRNLSTNDMKLSGQSNPREIYIYIPSKYVKFQNYFYIVCIVCINNIYNLVFRYVRSIVIINVYFMLKTNK